MYLYLAIEQVQRDVAAWPTGELRTEIARRVSVLDGFIDQLSPAASAGLCPDGESCASCDVLNAALLLALYVRELTRRPAEPDVFAQVGFSIN